MVADGLPIREPLQGEAMTNDLAHIIDPACRYLSKDGPAGAAQTIATEYPFDPKPNGTQGQRARPQAHGETAPLRTGTNMDGTLKRFLD